MDEVLESLTDFVETISPAHLDATTIHNAKRRIVDHFGCAIGAIDSPPAQSARRMASRVHGTPSATVLGLQQQSALEMVVFANTAMGRYFDFNDGYITPLGPAGHLSDTIPAQLAVAEGQASTGISALVAIAISYQVMAALGGIARLRERGWDVTLFLPTAVALASGKLLGLTRQQLADAAAITVTSSISTRNMRVGELSMWKGCASAWAARNGISAAMMAGEGITGPNTPFTGKDGIMDLVAGQQFSLDLSFPLHVFEKGIMKNYPSDGNSQAPIELMLSLRDRVPVDEIESIHLDTYLQAYTENGMEPEKWDPQGPETADHSLPYVLAAALVDGAVNLNTFTESRVADPDLRPFMNRITVSEKKEYTDKYPDEHNNTITIKLRSGEVVEGTTHYAYGHPRNPLSDDTVNAKFDELCRWSNQDQKMCNELREACWNLDQLDDLSEIFAIMGRLHTQ